MLQQLKKEIKKLSDPERAKAVARYFKTGKGEYGEGDIFIGLTVPQIRSLVAKYKDLSYPDTLSLLKSETHEERAIAILILVRKFKRADESERKKIYALYLKNTKHINNWDLVDASADKIVGEYLVDKPRDILLKLAKSNSLWERRISIISTFAFLKLGESEWSFKVGNILLNDKTDLIQKALGWTIREVGNKCGQEKEEEFLRKNYSVMGRTCLRYAIEKFPEEKRMRYLKGKI